MSDKCECPAAGFCTRRKTDIVGVHFNRCKNGEVEILDRLYSQIKVSTERSNKASAVKAAKAAKVARTEHSNIGTILAEIIKEKTGTDIPCGECKAEIVRLNSMTPAQVMQDIDALTDRIVERSKANAQRWYHKLLVTFLPDLVRHEVRSWIKLACDRVTPPTPKASLSVKHLRTVCGSIHDSTTNAFFEYIDPIIPGVVKGNNDPQCHRRIVDTLGHADQLKAEVIKWNGGTDAPTFNTIWVPGTWCYAVTTVPSRKHNTLTRTLRSLAVSGFDQPILSVDGPPDPAWNNIKLETIFRGKNIKTTGHWLLTLTEMYIRNPWTERYAIFQDDFVCVKNLKEYLSSQPIPENGYLNLLTFMDNDAIIADTNHGWHQSNQKGRGAVALVFSNEGVRALISHPYMMSRFLDSIRGIRVLDGGIVDAMAGIGWKEYIHNPSLIQHTGVQSSMGNKRHPTSNSFPGENFDAMTYLQ